MLARKRKGKKSYIATTNKLIVQNSLVEKNQEIKILTAELLKYFFKELYILMKNIYKDMNDTMRNKNCQNFENLLLK